MKPAIVKRRDLLLGGTSLGLGSALAACQSGAAPSPEPRAGAAPAAALPGAAAGTAKESALSIADPILQWLPLGSPPWKTFDPFLFCVHHRDEYPRGNAALGPTASLAGRNIGQDFAGKDGWSMYHGDIVPGFPRHPHRGFETVTITRRGYVDHSDSLGATARYGQGDVQWMTAGSGIVHAEMFPLLDPRAQNPTELFQVWLNLPARSKFVPPHFSMFWNDAIPLRHVRDAAGRSTSVTVIAGSFDGQRAPAPPPNSWASQADADVAIWSIRMQAGASFQLPAGPAGSARTLYYFNGAGLRAAGRDVPVRTALRLRAEAPLLLESGASEAELLLLAGRPIGEPVVQHGPFVMNQRSEIEQAVRDYQRTQFGGWPWGASGPVHPRDSGRFAVHSNGKKERA
jgi:redox-sensitive bicupin YhaK (pirin superfamily)